MKSSRSFILGAVLVTALIGGSGVTWASTSPSSPAAYTAPAAAKPLDTGSPAGASNYVPMTPCREVDTRYASVSPGPVPAGTTREVDFTGKASELTQQGGQYGCLIPYTATAVQVVITATGAAGAGDLAAWSLSGSFPGTRVLSYGPIGESSTSATIAVSGGDIYVEPQTYSTNLIIDVQGYYTADPQPETLTASIGFNGFLGANTHVTNVVNASGRYQITFDRDITACTFQATEAGEFVFLDELQPFAPGSVTNTVLAMWEFGNGSIDTSPRFELTGTCTS